MSVAQERYGEVVQQERAMAAFMDSFSACKASKLAELEGMQMAGASRKETYNRMSVPDLAPTFFDESQVTVHHHNGTVYDFRSHTVPPFITPQLCYL